MAKLIMWNVVSLDGYFEGQKPWDLPWHELVWGEELEALSLEQLRSASGLLFGRRTFEGMAAYWKPETDAVAGYMNSLPKYVASRTLTTADWNNSTVLPLPLEESLPALKASLDRDLYLFGSADLLQSLVAHRLVDEYRLGLAPHLHGSGSLLFRPGLPESDLTLAGLRELTNGGVILTYRPRTGA